MSHHPLHQIVQLITAQLLHVPAEPSQRLPRRQADCLLGVRRPFQAAPPCVLIDSIPCPPRARLPSPQVASRVAGCSGPQLSDVTTPDAVRLYDDLSTWTGELPCAYTCVCVCMVAVCMHLCVPAATACTAVCSPHTQLLPPRHHAVA